jgi:auxin efflux carrier family protein
VHAKNIAHLGVTLFLPALLFSEIGPQASASNLLKGWVPYLLVHLKLRTLITHKDWIIIVLAIWFQVVSFVAAVVLRKLFSLPQWLVPCLVFNNVTSLPLLMFSSLESQGALDALAGKGETLDALSRRARSYILIHALVCNLSESMQIFTLCTQYEVTCRLAARFLFGPKLMLPSSQIDHIFTTHFETPHLPHLLPPKDSVEDTPQDNTLRPDDAERQPLLHHSQSSGTVEAQLEGRKERAKSLLYRTWSGLKAALNPPLIGGLAAVFVGVIPFLHKLFLSDNSPIAAFTVSIEKIGELYTSLQIFVLGGQLYSKRQVSALTLPLFFFTLKMK